MGAVENDKEIADLIGKFHDIELNRRILKLEEEIIDLTRDKRRAEEKVEELERTLRFKGDLEFDAPFYWIVKDMTPFCPGCWEVRQKAVHVILEYDSDREARLDCPACKRMYLIRATPWSNLRRRRANTELS